MSEKYVVAVCSANRPLGLRRVVSKILEQVESSKLASVSLLIVDNDSGKSGKKIYEEIVSQTNVPLKYLHAKPAGLVVARNMALRFALEAQANLIFIDDDEIPHSGWLEAYIAANIIDGDSIWAGPVIPVPEAPIPRWAQSGNFWKRSSHQNHKVLDSLVGDGNLLLPVAFLNSGLIYDMKFNTAGGQDTDILTRWKKFGGLIRWSADAAVDEFLPESRLRLKYLVSRAHFGTLSYVWVERKNGRHWFVKAILRSSAHVLRSVIFLMRALLTFDLGFFAKAVIALGHASGNIAGIVLSSYDRYKKYQQDTSSAN